MDAVEQFFARWFPIYNLPGTYCYRAQAALFGVHHGVTTVVGDQLPDWERRQAVSAVRAGYCVAVVEAVRRDRSSPEANLRRLFAAMEQHESPGTNPDDETPGAAMLVGERIGRVAIQMAVDEPETARGLPGFSLREAVFADLRSTLFSKLKIARTATVNIDSAEVIMRVGHAVGVCEEAALQPRSSD